MKKLIFVILMLLISSFVFAQDINSNENVNPQPNEVGIYTTDGRSCKGLVDMNACANVVCNTGQSAKSCPISGNQTCQVSISKDNPMCISFGCGDAKTYSEQCIEDKIIERIEIIVSPQVSEVVIVSQDPKLLAKQCKGWIATSQNGEKCAYAQCDSNTTKLGEWVTCPSTPLPDYVPQNSDYNKDCSVSIDQTNNCVVTTCHGFSQEHCMDSFVASTIASRSCTTMLNYFFDIWNYSPQQTVDLQNSSSQTINLNGKTYTIQLMTSAVSNIACPTTVSINNSPSIYIPNVSIMTKIPSLGIELTPLNVTNDYKNNSSSAKFGIRSIDVNVNAPVQLVETNLTLWGQLLSWLGIVKPVASS